MANIRAAIKAEALFSVAFVAQLAGVCPKPVFKIVDNQEGS